MAFKFAFIPTFEDDFEMSLWSCSYQPEPVGRAGNSYFPGLVAFLKSYSRNSLWLCVCVCVCVCVCACARAPVCMCACMSVFGIDFYSVCPLSSSSGWFVCICLTHLEHGHETSVKKRGCVQALNVYICSLMLLPSPWDLYTLDEPWFHDRETHGTDPSQAQLSSANLWTQE